MARFRLRSVVAAAAQFMVCQLSSSPARDTATRSFRSRGLWQIESMDQTSAAEVFQCIVSMKDASSRQMHCEMLIITIFHWSLRAVYHSVTLIMYIVISWRHGNKHQLCWLVSEFPEGFIVTDDSLWKQAFST
ncbi:uncharacterized protein [Lolium perenne]|uniref:uncharacterized protein n=1 Tax=Lolium perenne TaxID=4522 RepID=UPI0021F5FDEB|nr:uncharacterized protein LOC127294629 [Lolium perenne]